MPRQKSSTDLSVVAFDDQKLPRPPRFGSYSALGSAVVVAFVTGFMLFINGSFVLAFVTVLVKTEVPIIGNDNFSQLLLFTIPVLMAIAEWVMLDYVRSRFRFLGRNDEGSSVDDVVQERRS